MFKINGLEKYYTKKIVSEDKLVAIIKTLEKAGKTVGLCVGGYDLLHPGHMKHLDSAKKSCDILVVAITSDEHTGQRKANGRPIFSENIRAYSVSQLESVDYVIISRYKGAEELIEILRPNFYIKGPDYVGKTTPGITREKKAIESVGGKIVFTKDEKLSTTELIKYIRSIELKKMLVVLDRDGTIIENVDFLGKDKDWKEQVQLNHDLINLLLHMNSTNDCDFIVVTNQGGVARGLFDEERVKEINSHIDNLLKQKGININQWGFCPDADREFYENNKEKMAFDMSYVKERTKRKPSVDMFNDALEKMNKCKEDYGAIIVFGDSMDDKSFAENIDAKYIDVKGKDFEQLKIELLEKQ
ncbi:MAG: HAD-IIIA family hydrolase [Nanoarchaeota archaeon]|nr:HAD-IIIA family hydrolase [Nanoarchaeota archaeon]